MAFSLDEIGVKLLHELERDADRAVMLEALRSDRYLALLDALEEAAEAPRVVDDTHSLASLWAREWKRLRKAASGLDDDPTDESEPDEGGRPIAEI